MAMTAIAMGAMVTANVCVRKRRPWCAQAEAKAVLRRRAVPVSQGGDSGSERIGEKGGKELAAAFAEGHCPKCKELDLTWNLVKTRGLCALAAAGRRRLKSDESADPAGKFDHPDSMRAGSCFRCGLNSESLICARMIWATRARAQWRILCWVVTCRSYVCC